MDLLQVKEVWKRFGESVVVKPLSLRFPAFRRVAIAGETGSGKTTLLKIIGGLIQPDAGTVWVEGERILGPDERLLPGHPRIAYLSQHFELRNNYRLNDFLEMASKVGKEQAQRIYELCQIDHLLKRRTDQLSGGERQRAALARLLTTAPRLLLLDEPYSNLDGLHKQVLKAVINAIVEEGTACIMVSHDPNDVLPWAEEILVLQNGRLVQQGTPEQVYHQPVSAYAGGLFGDYNLLTAIDANSVFGMVADPTATRLFIRPEGIRITKNHTGTPGGIITAIYFFGSYSEVEIQFSKLSILVKTTQSGLQKGEKVWVTVLPEHICYLPA